MCCPAGSCSRVFRVALCTVLRETNIPSKERGCDPVISSTWCCNGLWYAQYAVPQTLPRLPTLCCSVLRSANGGSEANQHLALLLERVLEPMSERANLLALPHELRIIIYHMVIHAATDIANGLDASANSKALTSDGRRSPYFTPWCSLMLTCSQIAAEMRDHLAKQISQERCSYITWVVELEIYRETGIKQANRRRLPCPPTHLRILRLETPLNGLENAWAIARILNQIVSLVLRRGPSLDAGRPSVSAKHKSLHIREVHLAFYWHCSKSQRRYGLPERILHRFRRLHQDLAAEGAGEIETIKLIDEYYEQSWPAIKTRS